jgi:hypothetical protein
LYPCTAVLSFIAIVRGLIVYRVFIFNLKDWQNR